MRACLALLALGPLAQADPLNATSSPPLNSTAGPSPPAGGWLGALQLLDINKWGLADWVVVVGGGGILLLLALCACWMCRCCYRRGRARARESARAREGDGKSKVTWKKKGRPSSFGGEISIGPLKPARSYGKFEEDDEPKAGKGKGKGGKAKNGGGTSTHTSHGGGSTGRRPGEAADWEELLDDDTGHPYWYNHATGETTWEMPADLIPVSLPKAPPPPTTSTLPPPPQLPLPAGWEAHEDDSGALYFFNGQTGETTWERPRR